MTKIHLTEGQIKRFIKESIKRYLIESVQNKVDNFDFVIDKILEFSSPDDFYFVQITKRFKDNKGDDRSQGNYHSGAWYGKSWWVHSPEELLELKDEIIDECEKNNARAYITVNPRSEKAVKAYSQQFKSMIARKHGQSDPRYIHGEEIVASQAKHGKNWWDERFKFHIDVDAGENDTRRGKKVWDIVRDVCKVLGVTIVGESVTPSGGLHVLCKDKRQAGVKYLQTLLNKEIDGGRDKGVYATAHVIFDAKWNLYSNVTTKGY